MRRVRWLLILAIGIILAAVGGSYYSHRVRQVREAPPPPPELPANITATSDAWVHTVYDGQRAVVEISATRMSQIREPSEFELEDVELRIFQPGGYDRVRSALARFDIEKGSLYSEGDVEIVLDVPEAGDVPEDQLLKIQSSGVHFETQTGRATTEKPTHFQFVRGEGRSEGATYDPRWHEVRMHREAELRWYGDGSPGSSMVVEAGEMQYKEDLSRVFLRPWSRFRKGNLSLNAGESVVTLEDHAVRQLNAKSAAGTHQEGKRRLDFGADDLVIHWTPDTAIERIVGDGSARLTSHDGSADTAMNSERLFLEFRPGGEESVLDHAVAYGKAHLESRPGVNKGSEPPPVRVLESKVIKAIMNETGEEIRRLETHAPGTLEFQPSVPGQRQRRMEAERMSIDYGEGNRPQSLRAVYVHTRTEGQLDGKGVPGPPALTWSDNLLAHFNPDGAFERLEQWQKFQYEEGEEKAKAEHAVFEVARNLFVLKGDARVWNPEGSTSAGEILLDQNQGVFTAIGQVSSTRLPDQSDTPGGMLAADKALHATAGRMTASADGSTVYFEEKVVLWQGPDRLTADRVDIDRNRGSLKARGSVVSRFAARETKANGNGAAGPFTLVQADELTYDGEGRVAHYRGAVQMTRPGLEIQSRELQAFFRELDEQPPEDSGTTLDHLVADGEVRVVHTGRNRNRTGLAEHGEYSLGDEKLVLSGGIAKLIDSERGAAQGRQLTYYARDDRLLVDGAETRPAVSRLRKAK